MRRRHNKFRYRPRRRNLGDQLMAMLNPPDAGIGVLSGVRPRNMIAVLPILGGAIANGYVRGQLIPSLSFMPKVLKSGLGNYLLGVGTSGVIGAIAGYFDFGIGQSMFVGGVSETAISAFAEGYAKRGTAKGWLAPVTPNLGGLFGMGEELEGCEGYGCGEEIEGLGLGPDDRFNMGLGPDDRFNMGDFVSPGQITGAMEIPSQAGQYPMPAQAMQPMAQLPGGPRRGPRMANTDDLEQSLLGELISQS